ncbi:hypothetical protein VNI00_016319 [Paramarasmius palmivorus]|uniref:C2H2-type domain-containing protein n=1 Tax=Paramarasmius palmivorus TaxID=297713 RepID=A0AAW0BCV3_9AGAR
MVVSTSSSTSAYLQTMLSTNLAALLTISLLLNGMGKYAETPITSNPGNLSAADVRSAEKSALRLWPLSRVGASIEISFDKESGAALMLPTGAKRENMLDLKAFREYAQANAASWYYFVNNTLGRDAENGSIYLVTGVDKSDAWENAIFDSSQSSQSCSLLFESVGIASGRMKLSQSSIYQSSVTSRASAANAQYNQALFIRGFRISLRSGLSVRILGEVKVASTDKSPMKDIFSPAPRFGQSGYSFSMSWGRSSTSSRSGSPSTDAASSNDGPESSDDSTTASDSDWDCHSPGGSSCSDTTSINEDDYFPPSQPYHPLISINNDILQNNPEIDVVVTHDDDWISLLTDRDTAMPDDQTLTRRFRERYRVLESNGIYPSVCCTSALSEYLNHSGFAVLEQVHNDGKSPRQKTSVPTTSVPISAPTSLVRTGGASTPSPCGSLHHVLAPSCCMPVVQAFGEMSLQSPNLSAGSLTALDDQPPGSSSSSQSQQPDLRSKAPHQLHVRQRTQTLTMHRRRTSFVVTDPDGDAKVIQDSLYSSMPDRLEYELGHMPTFLTDIDNYSLTSHQSPSVPSPSPTTLTPGISSLGLTTEDLHFTSTLFENIIKPPRIQDLPACSSSYSSSFTGGITFASTQSSWLPTPVTPSVPGTVPPNFLRLDKPDDLAQDPTLFRNTVYEDTVDPSALRIGRGRGLAPITRRSRCLSVNRQRRDGISAGYSYSVFSSPGALGLHGGTSGYDAQATSPVKGSEGNSFLESLLFAGSSFEGSADGGMTQIELEDGGVLGPGFEFAAGSVRRRTIASDDVLKASRKRRKDPGEGEFKCHIYSQDYTAQHNLTNHINAHRGIEPFECPHCHKYYTTKHVLDHHMKTAVGCSKANRISQPSSSANSSMSTWHDTCDTYSSASNASADWKGGRHTLLPFSERQRRCFAVTQMTSPPKRNDIT